MRETYSECLIYHESPQLVAVVKEATSSISLQTMPIMSRCDYDRPGDASLPFERTIDVEREKGRVATIVHSSGSTGLPKPIDVAHVRYTVKYDIGPGDRDFVTLPL